MVNPVWRKTDMLCRNGLKADRWLNIGMILTGCTHTAWHWIICSQAKTPRTAGRYALAANWKLRVITLPLWVQTLPQMNPVPYGTADENCPCVRTNRLLKKHLPFFFIIICFTFMEPCIVNVLKHNQQDATLYNGIYYYKWSTCFRRFLRPKHVDH